MIVVSTGGVEDGVTAEVISEMGGSGLDVVGVGSSKMKVVCVNGEKINK